MSLFIRYLPMPINLGGRGHVCNNQLYDDEAKII